MRGLSGDDLGSLVAALIARAEGQRADEGPLLARLALLLTRSARAGGALAVASGRWLAQVLVDTAPRVPVRTLPVLQTAYPGLDADGIAGELIEEATRTTAAIGAAGGAVSAAGWTVPPALLATTPPLVAAETLAVAAVEVRLVAELHEAYGRRPAVPPTQLGVAYLWSWTHRRALDPDDPPNLAEALRGAPLRALRNRLLRRAGRNLPSVGPLLSGALVAGVTNARETRQLGEQLRADLRA